MSLFPFLIGVGVTATGAALIASSLRRAPDAESATPEGQVAACSIGLVFFGPGRSMSSRAIDAATGGLGFSHVAIQGCEVGPGGAPLLIDCQAGYGVHRRPESDPLYSGRPRARALLVGPGASEMYGCARAKVGADFAPSGDRGGYLCSQLALECLPASLRGRVADFSRYAGPGGVVSPNQIAAALGVRPGQIRVVEA